MATILKTYHAREDFNIMTKTGITRTLNYLESMDIVNVIWNSRYCRKYRYFNEDKNTRMDIIVFNNDNIVTFRINYLNIDHIQIIQKRYIDFRNMEEFRLAIMDIIQKHIIDCEYA